MDFADDLRLARACAQRDAGAIAELEQKFFPRLSAAIGRIDASESFADEARQALREKLFVSGRIADYGGQGPLLSWLRATAVRTALNLKRPEAGREPDPRGDEALEAMPLAGADPELALMREQHRPVFKTAFRAALADLPARERTVLKMQLVDGISLESIGGIYGVNKSTVSRWTQKALETLVDGTRSRVARQLALDSAELESLMRLVRSGLEISVAALLDE